MEIKYDTPIEVTAIQYANIISKFAGAVAGRIEGEGSKKKYFIKVWLTRYKNLISKELES